jgi:hypothetical protein
VSIVAETVTGQCRPVGAGIRVQRAADRAGKTDEAFQTCQPLAHGGGDDVPELGAAAGGDSPPCDRDISESCRGQMNHHAADPFVADQEIGAAAEDAHGDAIAVAALHQPGQLIDRRRLGEELCRSAEPQPGVGS